MISATLCFVYPRVGEKTRRKANGIRPGQVTQNSLRESIWRYFLFIFDPTVSLQRKLLNPDRVEYRTHMNRVLLANMGNYPNSRKGQYPSNCDMPEPLPHRKKRVLSLKK